MGYKKLIEQLSIAQQTAFTAHKGWLEAHRRITELSQQYVNAANCATTLQEHLNQAESRIAELEAIREQQAKIIRNREDEIKELEAAQAQTVPDGWNPTDEQLDAITPRPESFGACEAPWSDRDRRILRTAMRAALNAAPAPAGSQQSEPVKYEVQNIFGGWVEISKTMFDSWDVGDGLNKRALYEQPPATNAAQDVRNQVLEADCRMYHAASEKDQRELRETQQTLKNVCEFVTSSKLYDGEYLIDPSDFQAFINTLKTPAKREG